MEALLIKDSFLPRSFEDIVLLLWLNMKKNNSLHFHFHPPPISSQAGKSINSFSHSSHQLKSHLPPDAQRCFTWSTSLNNAHLAASVSNLSLTKNKPFFKISKQFIYRRAASPLHPCGSFLVIKKSIQRLEALSSATVNVKRQSASARHPLCVLVSLETRMRWSFASHWGLCGYVLFLNLLCCVVS